MSGTEAVHAGIQILTNHPDGSIRQYNLYVFFGEVKPFVFLCECEAGDVYEAEKTDLIGLAARTLKLLGVTDRNRIIH